MPTATTGFVFTPAIDGADGAPQSQKKHSGDVSWILIMSSRSVPDSWAGSRREGKQGIRQRAFFG